MDSKLPQTEMKSKRTHWRIYYKIKARD